MSSIDFNVTGLDELSDNMSRGPTFLKIALNEGLRAIGRLFVPAKGTGPLAAETPKITGKLRYSTYFQIEGGIQAQRLVIRQPARTPSGEFYGFFVREGTPPHDIRPVNKQALRFMIGGAVIFAKVVHHPGSKANPYHKRVMARLQPQIQSIVKQMGQKVTAHMSGG